MPSIRSFAALLALGAVGTGCAERPVELVTLADSGSYALGMNLGATVREMWGYIDQDALLAGLRDVGEDGEAALPRGAAMMLMTELMARTQEARETAGRERVAAGAAYRERNARRPGVRTTASGLQYEVLTPGTGAAPTLMDRVRVHYRGTLIDGTEFESTYGDEPIVFEVNEVLRGWIEALQMMQVGAKYRIVVPPQLGYGPAGAPGIEPQSTLVFEIELLEILP